MDTATHALYILLDSNLPTGGFVASSGLESYAKHGFLLPSRTYGNADAADISGARAAPGREWGGAQPKSAAPMGPSKAGAALAEFARAEVANFETSTGWYLAQSWGLVSRALGPPEAEAQDGDKTSTDEDRKGGTEKGGMGMGMGMGMAMAMEHTLAEIVRLDHAHESTLLSHVARRASRAQGVALLTLYGRGLGPPPGFDDDTAPHDKRREASAQDLVGAYKKAVRRGAPGHLAVCFGVVAAALGMDLETARHLYLFTHARSLVSSAVRLNIVGPYLSTQLLSHPLRQTIAAAMASDTGPPDVPRGKQGGECGPGKQNVLGGPDEQEGEEDESDEWAWAADAETGPATTWPLGEILAARHDLQHSRIFNS